MSNQDNTDAILAALRRAGLVTPIVSSPSIASVERTYWHVYCGAFDTFVDSRDASTQDDALNVAVQPLQPWYVRKISFAEAPHVESASRKDYIEWLKRGVS